MSFFRRGAYMFPDKILVIRVLVGALLVLATAFSSTSAGEAASQEGKQRPLPNIVLLVADDMRVDDLQFMPKTRKILEEGGTNFTSAYVPYSTCCPSRTSILRGQYTHNHQVLDNDPPYGGFARFRALGHENSNLATVLKDAGYTTGLFGKYLNKYDQGEESAPKGWDEWFSKLEPRQGGYYDYEVNDNGKRVRYGRAPEDYYTDVLASKVERFVDRRARRSDPFFAYVAPSAPHGPLDSAPRHRDSFLDISAPRPPNFNESDVSDKQSRLADDPSLTIEQEIEIDERYRERARTLQALDEMVRGIYRKVKKSGELSNTYFVFTSDNGYHLGEHRLHNEKRTPYEEAIHVPLLIRGPGVPQGETTSNVALNIDLLPTLAEWAKTQAPSYVDGRSLVDAYDNADNSSAPWRVRFLLENMVDDREYYGVKEGSAKYVLFEDGFREFYDLEVDPYEMESDPSLAPAELQTALDELITCAGEECRTAEGE